jgi:aspartyl-tRNA(Asn)/glutamyl-tRNA(Gln) amidotransferase subunit A
VLDDPTLLSITEVSEKIRLGEFSPIELVNLSLEKIEKLDERLNSFTYFAKKQAKQAAKKAEVEIRSGKYRGPLHGVPIGVKDIIDVEGMITTNGSSIFRKNFRREDAFVVQRLREAGAIIIGKTNTHEFALGVTTNNPHYGATRNPWNLDLIPGGSSGGSAAATSAHLCFAALGSDTGGSIRIPAAFCGLVGLKPTYGRVSLNGVFPLATVFDHVGPITRTVADSAILLQYMAGFDAKDPRSLMMPSPEYSSVAEGIEVEGIRIGFSEELAQLSLDPDVKKSFNSAVSLLENLGGEIFEVKFPTFEKIRTVSTILLSAEAAVQHSELLRNHYDEYSSGVASRLKAGQKISTREYIDALREREAIIREMDILFRDVEFLLSPSVQIKPPEIGQDVVIVDSNEISVLKGCTQFTRLANITGIPAISLPFGYSSNSLPLSIQLMAPRLGETKLLKLAATLEDKTSELRNRTPI